MTDKNYKRASVFLMQAESFYVSGDVLWEKRKKSRLHITMPAITCYAMASELAIKSSILLQGDESFPVGQDGHNLKLLYERLKMPIQDSILNNLMNFVPMMPNKNKHGYGLKQVKTKQDMMKQIEQHKNILRARYNENGAHVFYEGGGSSTSWSGEKQELHLNMNFIQQFSFVLVRVAGTLLKAYHEEISNGKS